MFWRDIKLEAERPVKQLLQQDWEDGMSDLKTCPYQYDWRKLSDSETFLM